MEEDAPPRPIERQRSALRRRPGDFGPVPVSSRRAPPSPSGQAKQTPPSVRCGPRPAKPPLPWRVPRREHVVQRPPPLVPRLRRAAGMSASKRPALRGMKRGGDTGSSEGFEARPRGRGRCERRARPSSRAGGPAPSPCVARSLATPLGAGAREEVGARCPKGRRASSHSEGGPAITRTGRRQARALPPAAGCLRRRFRSMSVPEAAETGRSRRQASRGGPAIVAVAAVAGPNEDGPVVGSAAERGRGCRP